MYNITFCVVCNKDYHTKKRYNKHEETKIHQYNMFQYDLNKHLDNLVFAGSLKEEDKKNVVVNFKTEREGDDRIYQSNNKKDIWDLMRKTF